MFHDPRINSTFGEPSASLVATATEASKKNAPASRLQPHKEPGSTSTEESSSTLIRPPERGRTVRTSPAVCRPLAALGRPALRSRRPER